MQISFRPPRVGRMGACFSTSKPARGTTVTVKAISAERAAEVRQRLNKLFEEKHCEPIMVRLAWHDSGSYSHAAAATVPWPKAGGATASIRFKPELSHAANAGLVIGLGLLEPLKEEFPEISWSDLIQLASAQAIEHAGGPHIPLRLGRLDADCDEQCAPDGRLPAAAAPFPDKAANPAAHLRNVFVKGYGLTDKDIVALSGAHTIGRARPERSGFGKEKTKYTENGPGAPGGQSWTPEWLKFDNSYFVDVKEQKDADLLVLPTDACLFEDEGFRPHAERYAADQEAFFKDYVESHLKLSELGAKFA